MQTSVTFKNLDSSEPLKEYVSEKLNRIDKFLDNPAEANVVLSVEKHRHIAEINIIGDRLKVNGKEETDDMYSAIDIVLDKLEKQIKKSKQKIKDRKGGAKLAADMVAKEMLGSGEDLTDESVHHVKVRNIEYKPMDVEEAIMQLELVPDNFLVFTNSRTERVNVVYRRKNGDYGLIQPNQ
jgi:putative sigma-54 modulation protein